MGQLGVGEPGPAFVHNGVSVGTPICYEGLYGNFYGGFVREGARALLISSNDGWWGDTPGHKHLFSIARLRAVEHRRAIARSANTGTSGFIDTRGDVQQKLGWDRRGILTGEVELNSELTFTPDTATTWDEFRSSSWDSASSITSPIESRRKPSGEVTGTDIRPLTRPA